MSCGGGASACCEAVELLDASHPDDAIEVPAGARSLILGPWDTIGPFASPPIANAGTRLAAFALSGWVRAAGGVGFWIRLEELGTQLFAAAYEPMSWYTYLEPNVVGVTPFYIVTHARAVQFVMDNPHATPGNLVGVITARSFGSGP